MIQRVVSLGFKHVLVNVLKHGEDDDIVKRFFV